MDSTAIQQDTMPTAIEQPQEQQETVSEQPVAHVAFSIAVERAPLLRSLSFLQNVVEKRNAIPILANIKVKAEGSNLELTATDLEMAVTDHIDITVNQPGEITIPAQTFYDVVRKLPDGSQIDLTTDASNGTLIIRSGQSHFVLPFLAADDFPVMKKDDFSHHFSLNASELESLIDKTRFSISTEETRYYLNGVYIHTLQTEQGNVFRAVSTDGHRLSQFEISAPEGTDSIPGVIIPKKAIFELKKIVENSDQEVQIDLSKTAVQFSLGKTTLTSRLIDGSFPDYSRVVPANNQNELDVNVKDFQAAIDRVATIASDKTNAIRLVIEPNKIKLSASSQEYGTGDDEIEVSYQGEPTEIAFNARYLLDVANILEGDSMHIIFADGNAPIIIKDLTDQSAFYVVMPMRA